jgi:hypothetical protein
MELAEEQGFQVGAHELSGHIGRGRSGFRGDPGVRGIEEGIVRRLAKDRSGA